MTHLGNNLFNDDINFEIGSKLWLVAGQGRINDELLNNINDKALDALNWFINDNIVDDIEANSSIIANDESQLALKFFVGDNIIERNFTLWENSQWR